MTKAPNALRALIENAAVRHWGGFLLGGALAFVTDGGILLALTKLAGVSPFVARIAGISVAMIVSWLVNRTITFAMKGPPSLAEFLRFAAVSWIAQAVNYGVFAAILLVLPGTEPILAFFLACLVSMIVAYAGFKHGVFKEHDWRA